MRSYLLGAHELFMKNLPSWRATAIVFIARQILFLLQSHSSDYIIISMNTTRILPVLCEGGPLYWWKMVASVPIFSMRALSVRLSVDFMIVLSRNP